jgi:hypothetical protein
VGVGGAALEAGDSCLEVAILLVEWSGEKMDGTDIAAFGLCFQRKMGKC